jgi:glutaredoxin
LQKKVPFAEFNVAADRESARKMVEKTGQLAVPVIVVDDTDVVVGFYPAKLDELLSGEKKQ